MDYRALIEAVGQYLDMAGVAVTVIGALVSVPLAFRAKKRTAADGRGRSASREP